MSAPASDAPEDRLRASWNANARAWTNAVRNEQIASRRLGTNQAVLEAVLRCGARYVLDAGCGEGWLVHTLAQRGCEAVGIDGSAALIAAAREGAGRFLVLGYDDMVGDPRRAGEAYDAVVCNFSLLGEEIQPLLRAIRTVLAPDGYLIIQTVHPFTACGEEPYRDGWRTETFEGFGEAFAVPMPWYYRRISTWMRELRTAGYTLEQCIEPQPEEVERPLSLLLVVRAATATEAGGVPRPDRPTLP
jgi:2-polyprenyl-3-methyl-5-hydroxy-6-metoxy-1,4-benzoquinol methylase